MIGKSYFVLFVCLLCTVLLMVGCSQNTAWQEELKTAARENRYALLFIADGKSAESKAMQANLRECVRNSPAQFRVVEANADKDKYSLIKFLKIGALNKVPLILALAPNGAITGSLSGPVTPETLQGFVVPAKEADILLSMQKKEIVLLCVHKGMSGELEAVKPELQALGANYAGKVSVYYADPTVPGDMAFTGKLPVVNANLAVLALAPTGKITATLEGPQINRQNLLKAVQSCSSGCSSGCK